MKRCKGAQPTTILEGDPPVSSRLLVLPRLASLACVRPLAMALPWTRMGRLCLPLTPTTGLCPGPAHGGSASPCPLRMGPAHDPHGEALHPYGSITMALSWTNRVRLHIPMTPTLINTR